MIHGILNVYKEKGFTSHDVVAKLRGIIGQRKIGHTGTLDPDAEGVLPVCLGKATKVCGLLAGKDKTYEAVLLLGRTTDTQDISGKVVRENGIEGLTEREVEEAVLSFVGAYQQIPPMFSALKVDGRKLYELAREGKTVKRSPRTVMIHAIRIRRVNLPRVEMEVVCSKGTYIRTLCHDIGEKLGTGGCMESLIRTRVSGFALEEARKLSDIQKAKDEGRIEEILIPVDQMFSSLRELKVEGKAEALAHNGNPFFIKNSGEIINDGEWVRVYDSKNNFVAIYEYEKEDKFRIVKMFFN